MTDDTHVDGNALGALFRDVFGREMTDERGCCGNCGWVTRLGGLMAYLDAPGSVLRCPKCDSVVAVAVASPSGMRVTFEALRWIELREVATV
jgi:Family of unknown function (DUF6510)